MGCDVFAEQYEGAVLKNMGKDLFFHSVQVTNAKGGKYSALVMSGQM